MPSPPLPISIPPFFIWVTVTLNHAANTALWSHVFRSEWRSIQCSTPFYLYGALQAPQTLSLVTLILSPTSFAPCLNKCHFLVTQFERRSLRCFVSSANLDIGRPISSLTSFTPSLNKSHFLAPILSLTSFVPCLDECHFLVMQFKRRSIQHPTPFIWCFVSSTNLELGCCHLISDLLHSIPRWMPCLSDSGVDGIMHQLDFHKKILGTVTHTLQPLPPFPLFHPRTSFTI